MRLTKVWDRIERAVVARTGLERRRDAGLCLGTVVGPGGSDVWCPADAVDGSWCEDHAVLYADVEDDLEDAQADPYRDDSELGSGMTRGTGRDERYEHRGRRWFR